MTTFSVREFGAAGDGAAMDTVAINKAAQACRDAGGGTLLFTAGTYLTGIFQIYSNTTLKLEEGARLLGSPAWEDHRFEAAVGGIVFARDAENVTLEGPGLIDGNPDGCFEEGRLNLDDVTPELQGWPANPRGNPVHGPVKPLRRPGNLIVLAGCRNVKMANLRITGATYWTIHLADCSDVEISGLSIDNNRRHPNNDGIHLTTCQRVSIRDCQISAGDDAIAITGFRNPGQEAEIALGLRNRVGVCEGISVRDCRLSSRSSAIRIGYGENPTRNVDIENITIYETNRAIGIYARQSGVSHVNIRNVTADTAIFNGNWWGRAEPLHISAVRYPGDPQLHAVEGVTVENMSAVAENGIHLFAEEPGAIRNIELKNVDVELRASELWELWGNRPDVRPAADAALESMTGGNSPIWAHNVHGLTLERFHSTVRPEAAAAFATELRFENCEGVLQRG